MTTHQEPEEFRVALDEHGERLVNELLALSELPQVCLTPAAVFDRAKPKGTVRPFQTSAESSASCCAAAASWM